MPIVCDPHSPEGQKKWGDLAKDADIGELPFLSPVKPQALADKYEMMQWLIVLLLPVLITPLLRSRLFCLPSKIDKNGALNRLISIQLGTGSSPEVQVAWINGQMSDDLRRPRSTVQPFGATRLWSLC